MPVVILWDFRSYIFVVSRRLFFRFMSFIFILNVYLTLQSSTNIRRHNQAARPMLVVSSLANHVECVWASEGLCGSTCKIERLLNSILTDIWSSKLLNLPIKRCTTPIVHHCILCEGRRRVREQLLVVLWEGPDHLLLLVSDQRCLPLLRESLLPGIVYSTLTSWKVEESRILRCLDFWTSIWKRLRSLQWILTLLNISFLLRV